MRTLILLFATLSTLQLSAQSPAAQSYGIRVQSEIVSMLTETAYQATLQAELLITTLQHVYPVLSTSLSGDKCTATVVATVTDESGTSESTFTFLGDTYPDLAVLEPSTTIADSAPAMATTSSTFDFLGDSFDEIPQENMLIPGSILAEPTFLFMGDTYQELPEEAILPRIML